MTQCLPYIVPFFEKTQKWMGHKDITMTANRYAHLSDDFTDEWIASMNTPMANASDTTAAPR